MRESLVFCAPPVATRPLRIGLPLASSEAFDILATGHLRIRVLTGTGSRPISFGSPWGTAFELVIESYPLESVNEVDGFQSGWCPLAASSSVLDRLRTLPL